MPKMIVSIEGVATKEAQLTQDRTSLSRRQFGWRVSSDLGTN